MTESMPLAAGLAAFLDGGISQFLFDAIKFLAIAAGAVVGWFVGAPIARVLVRLAFHRDTPQMVQTVARFGGAVLVGFLIYLIPIGPGGSGGGFGFGGDGKGKDKGKDSGADSKPAKKRKGPEDKVDRDRKKADVPEPDVLVIRVLGGDAVKEERYYQIKMNGKATPMNEDEVQKYLAREGEHYSRVKIFLNDDSVDRTTLVVTDLVKLCKKYILDVRVEEKK